MLIPTAVATAVIMAPFWMASSCVLQKSAKGPAAAIADSNSGEGLNRRLKPRDETVEHLTPVEGTRGGHLEDDSEEADDHDADHDLQNPFEDSNALATRVIEPDDDGRDDEQNGDAGGFASRLLQRLRTKDVREQVLLQGRRPQTELRHCPDHVGHERADRPAPAEDRIDVSIDGSKRSLSRGQGHIRDGAEHDDAENHRHRLPPQHAKAGENSQIQAPPQRSTTQSDRTLQPAGARQLGERPQQRPLALFAGLGNHLPVVLDLGRFGDRNGFFSRRELRHREASEEN